MEGGGEFFDVLCFVIVVEVVIGVEEKEGGEGVIFSINIWDYELYCVSVVLEIFVWWM